MTTMYDAPSVHVTSITLHPRQLVRMKIAVAKQFLADPGALHEEADVELVGHAHAAMHLHTLLDRRAGDFDLDIKLRGAMLQRLEFADRLAELLALLEVANGAAEHLLAEPDHFGGHRAAADIEYAFKQPMTLIDL